MTSAKRIKSPNPAGKEKENKPRPSSERESSAATHCVRKATAKKKSVKETAQKKNLSNSALTVQSKKKSVSSKAIPSKRNNSPASGKSKAGKKSIAEKPVKKAISHPVSSRAGSGKAVLDKTTAKSAVRKTDSKKKTSKKHSSKTEIQFPTTVWGADSVIGFEATDHYPPPELTSIVGGFVFYGDSVLLANIPGRGWEIIGGRIDLGETPEVTFRRETMKQLGVSLTGAIMIGVIRIEHTGPEPPNCPYPFPIGYGIQYIGIAEELLPFNGNEESLGRSLISFEGFKEHYYDWNEFYEAVFTYACSVYKKWRKKKAAL